MWGQYCLDQFATVAEAVESFKTSPYQLQMAVEPTSLKAATKKINFDADQSVRKLALVSNHDHYGDVSDKFEASPMFQFLAK
jgi:penicillin V acylase-like amidase (Ntn superfamily)